MPAVRPGPSVSGGNSRRHERGTMQADEMSVNTTPARRAAGVPPPR